MDTPRRVLRNLQLENLQQISTPLKIPASPFMKNLGYGTGVNVYKLERSPQQGQIRSPWAIKRVSKRTTQEALAELFNSRIQKEAKILRKLSHPNIVGFRGITKTSEGLDTLVLECCKISLGDILENRYEQNLKSLPAPNIRKVITDVTQALDYLHTEVKLLHGDLKSFNVLIKGDFEICKLCDFGVSIILDEKGQVNFNENPTLSYVGTSIWSAPEVIDESDILDCKADIFSFGLIIYETIALSPPHTSNYGNNDNDESSLNDSSLEEIANNWDALCGTRPPLPQSFELSEEYKQIVELFYCCTQQLPEDRPTAKTILQALNEIK